MTLEETPIGPAPESRAPRAARRPRALLVERDATVRAAARGVLERDGWRVDAVANLDAALMLLRRGSHAALIVEAARVAAPAADAVRRVRTVDPEVPVIVTVANASVHDVVCAMRAGAADVLPRPLLERDLLRAARDVERARGSRVAPEGGDAARPPRLIGESPAMRVLRQRIALVAQSRSTVLLVGETGTGKERVAEAIHAASPRGGSGGAAPQPFVRVHCGALAEPLLESELFGHEKGAFTGALSQHLGRFELAHRGTILLDEIGEISPAMQVKLLRVLQDRTFERVGGTATLAVDVRVIAATHRDLRAMVEAGTFRADLYYRLNVVTIELPPLRVRRDDIPRLAEHILAQRARELGVPAPSIVDAAMQRLVHHDWPGNVRELENVLERALVTSRERAITAESLDLGPAAGPDSRSGARIPGASFAEIERYAVLATYEACGRSVALTAEVLGLSRRTVHYRLREYSGRVGRRARTRAAAAAQDASREP